MFWNSHTCHLAFTPELLVLAVKAAGRKEVIVVWWDASKVDPRELGTSVFSSLTLILKTNIICFDFSY